MTDECRHYLGIVRQKVMLRHGPELDNGSLFHLGAGAGLTQAAAVIGLTLSVNKVMAILIIVLMILLYISKLPRPEHEMIGRINIAGVTNL